jgi:hypothetical protein
MTYDYSQLKPLLRAFVDRTASNREITRLVHFSRSVVQAHLKTCTYSTLTLCSQQGISISDLAMDCLGEIFARDTGGGFTRIGAFVDSLHFPLEEIADADLMLAFKALLVAVTRAQIARLYAANDPAGAKIHRNICLQVAQNDRLEIIRTPSGLTICQRHTNHFDNREPYPFDELKARFLEIARPAASIPDLLATLHEVLVNQERYRRAVRVTDMVLLCKIVYVRDEPANDEELQLSPADGLTEPEIRLLCAQVEDALKEKIFVSYVVRGKLGVREGEAIHAALVDLVRDWCSLDGEPKGLYEYLRRHLVVDGQRYESSYRTKLEYLIRVARDEFRARLLREL